MQNKVKIIGGKYRGKIINFPNDAQIRPTPNRVRETVFNWLSYYITNSHCLDLFAGSGTLSFEALSRKAKKITLVELNKNNYQNLKKTAKIFPSEINNINIINQDSLKFLQIYNPAPFDIIFIDPPFDKLTNQFIIAILAKLRHNNYINKSSLVYLESNVSLLAEISASNFTIIKQKKISSIYIYLIKLIQ